MAFRLLHLSSTDETHRLMRGTSGVRVAVITVALGFVAIACGSDDGSAGSSTANSSSPGAAVTPATDAGGTTPTSPADAAAATSDTSSNSDDDAASEQMFPDVIDATAESDGETWTVSATLSSPYDSPERYADAWRVVGSDGEIYGERELTHDHAAEQPFTRSESGIEIPDDVDEVTIEGRDLDNGYGGETFALALPR